jgi:PleD family two-component response regulator
MPVVLVVDDEAYSRYATVRALQTAGFDVRECSTASTASARPATDQT